MEKQRDPVAGRRCVLRIVDAVEDAVGKECWIPALMTALTLPDILGQVEFPDMVGKGGRRLVGRQYEAWFDRYVACGFADDQGLGEDHQPIHPYFTAEMCYRLRCLMLHQGNDDLSESPALESAHGFRADAGLTHRYRFELLTDACNCYGTTTIHGEQCILVRLNVKDLCDRLCAGARQCLRTVSDRNLGNVGIRLVADGIQLPAMDLTGDTGSRRPACGRAGEPKGGPCLP